MESSIQTNDVEVKPKVKVIRPKTAPHRYKEDGTYDNKPLNKKYWTEYYHTHKVESKCEHCNMTFTHKNGLYKHGFRSKTCKVQQELTQLRVQIKQLQAQQETPNPLDIGVETK